MLRETATLEGRALDWAVAQALLRSEGYREQGLLVHRIGYGQSMPPFSTDWSLAGPIIEREGINLIRADDEYGTDAKGFTTSERFPVWGAYKGESSPEYVYGRQGDDYGKHFTILEESVVYGNTPLVAAMRCYVASKLGETVDIPDELI